MNQKFFFAVFALLMAIAPSLNAQTARVQIIHNSADAAAATVDIYANGVIFLSDVAFRTATAFTDVPAGVNLAIAIAPGNSTSAAQAVGTFNVNFTAGETYVVVANGIVSGTGYNPAPAFDLDVYNMGREAAAVSTNTDLLVVHGATDAPTVDVVAPGAGTLVDNLAYGSFNGYLELPTADYTINVTDQTGSTVVASYQAPLQTLGLQGAAGVVVASGFLDPSQNSNGAAFGLWVALPTGGALVQLPGSTARVQVIHNCADAAASTVDVWLDNTLLIDNFAFRTASPFVNAPAETNHIISIAASNSTNANQGIAFFPITLSANEKYVVVANGIVNSALYSPAPAFDLDIYDMAQETSTNVGEVSILVAHGSTDAPTVDVQVPGVGTVVNDLAYGSFNGYLNVPTANYTLNVADATGTTVVASYQAPLQTLSLQNQAIVVVASGFLNPAVNSNGPGFGLWVATGAGGPLLPLPQSTARVQVIHNCADAAADSVDVYLGNTLLLDNFLFRTATPFVDAPAEVGVVLGVAPANSTSAAQSIATFPVTLTANSKYIVVANGIVSPTGYSPAPTFALSIFDAAREVATMGTNTDILVMHGSTDAPVVDVEAAGATLVDDAAYGDFAGYLEVPAADYSLDVTDNTGNTVVASYLAPLQTLGLAGDAITVVASGFLAPVNNSNGPAFGLWAATAAGGALVQLPTPTSINDPIEKIYVRSFPNPANTAVNVQLTLNESSPLQASIIDATGRTVRSFSYAKQAAGNFATTLNVADLSAGLYTLNVVTNSGSNNMRLNIQR